MQVVRNIEHWLCLMYVKAFCHIVLHFFEFGKQDSIFYTTLLWGLKMKNSWWSLLILNGKYITFFFFSLFKALQDPVIISWDYYHNIIINIWFCLIHEFSYGWCECNFFRASLNLDINVILLEIIENGSPNSKCVMFFIQVRGIKHCRL